jgi:predicted phage terminase large subunit-like protein
MQRLHESDLSGWLLAGGNGEGWDHVCIPAIDEHGISFWPDQFPVPDLERKRLANSYVFAGQYMQRPAPVGGGILKDEWWRYYTAPPALEYRTIYADTAQKTGTQNDYSVFQLWGKSRDGQAVMLDQVRGKWEAPELLVQARAFWAKHKPGAAPLRAFKVEDKVSGTGLIQTLKREGLPMLAIQRDRDKVTRAYDAAPMIESGNVLLPANAPWLSDFLAEATVFPNGQHDDQLDPMFDAVSDMLTAPQAFFAVI